MQALTHDVNDVTAHIAATPLDVVLDSEAVRLASAYYDSIQNLWGWVSERPVRYGAAWGQGVRAAGSVVLNICEAAGKGRGYFVSALMIARGEAFESAGFLLLLPGDVAGPLKGMVKDLVRALDALILAADGAKQAPAPTCRSWRP